jgi:uncharacterized alpha-E superfamily protein
MPITLGLVLDLMLFDPNNPRSLTYQVNRLKVYLKNLPKNPGVYWLTEYERLILEADALLKLADKNELTLAGPADKEYRVLNDFLSKMYGLLSGIPDVISKTYFKHERAPKI